MQIHEITLKEAAPLSQADAAEMEKRRQKAAQIAGADPMTQAVGNWLANKIGPRGLPSQRAQGPTQAQLDAELVKIKNQYPGLTDQQYQQALKQRAAQMTAPPGTPVQQPTTTTPSSVAPQASGYYVRPGRRIKIAVQTAGQEQPSFYYKNSSGVWTNELGQKVRQSSYASLEKYATDNGGREENDPDYVNPNDQVKSRKVSRKR